MKAVLSFTKRNMLMFAKNRGAVFFSMLSAIMIIVLYMLFLAKTNIDSVQNIIKADRTAIAFLVNSWVMGGIIAVNSVTVTMGVLGIMVEDEAKNRLSAFLVAPVSRLKLTMGYVISAFAIGIVLCIFTFILSQIYIMASGGSLLSPVAMLKVLGIIIASVFSSTCLIFLLVSFIRTTNTYTTVSIFIGTVIGLVAGIYVPVGTLPDAVQKFMKFLPVFYEASLMRGVFMKDPAAVVFKHIHGNIVSSYMNSMGVNISWGGTTVSSLDKLAVVVVSGVIFLILSAAVMRSRKIVRV